MKQNLYLKGFNMKTYTIYASQLIHFKKEVQANSKEEAEELSFKQTENDWEEFDYGEWLTESIEEN